MSDQAHESHTGPIKTPRQLLWTSFFAFVLPVFIIIGLVFFVTRGDKPAPGTDNTQLALEKRIQRVGSVELGDAQAGGGAMDGETLFKTACINCHGSGVMGAPKFGDKAAWGPRLGAGIAGLTASAIKGKNAMPARGGTSASDDEIKAAVTYMFNAVK